MRTRRTDLLVAGEEEGGSAKGGAAQCSRDVGKGFGMKPPPTYFISERAST